MARMDELIKFIYVFQLFSQHLPAERYANDSIKIYLNYLAKYGVAPTSPPVDDFGIKWMHR